MKTLQHAGAFVVQFRADCILGGGALSGRIEHVASGRTVGFHSREELVDVLEQMVKELRTALDGA